VTTCQLWQTGELGQPLQPSSPDCLVGSQSVTGAYSVEAEGQQECYMVFADLSIRRPGNYRLRFTLVDVEGYVGTKRVAIRQSNQANELVQRSKCQYLTLT
jgi:Velvet factor